MHKIRQASFAEIPLIRELTLSVWPQTYSSILSKDQVDFMLDMMYSEASLEKQMKEGAEFIIVYYDDQPVGFASFQQSAPGVYKLHKLYVLGSQQGKGTGRIMIDYIIDKAMEAGGRSLQLQVNRDNKAKEFYQKLGFTIIKEADFDIGHGFFMNDYVMERNL